MGDSDKIDQLVDIALEESFPASDPPSFMAASAVVGAPTRPKLSGYHDSEDAPPIRGKKQVPK